MRTQLSLALLATSLATSLIACVDDGAAPAGSEPSVDEVASSLELENGGLDTADEAPQFAAEAAYAAAEIEADATFADPMASDPTLADPASPSTTPPSGPTVAGRDLLIMWGQLPPDRAVAAQRDWSGKLELSRGGMLLRHTIAFEPATDRILPRTSPRAISFESITRPAADGLVLSVFDPNPATTPLTLTYTPVTGLPQAFDLSQLVNGPIVVDAGDGNKIVIAGHRRVQGCAHGFLRGRWHTLAPHASAYLGMVMNSDGAVIGHLRGIAGTRQNGDAVMFGKFIAVDGRFMGLVKGTYDNGKFVARWLDRAGDHGKLGGVYFPGPTAQTGAFVGRWAETACEQ